MYGVRGSGHFDRMEDICCHRYFNKLIKNLVEHCEMCQGPIGYHGHILDMGIQTQITAKL